MAKIVHFPDKNAAQVEKIEKLLQAAKNGEITRFIFAAELKEENNGRPLIATSWDNADLGDRQYLIGHLQADVNFGIVEVNLIEE